MVSAVCHVLGDNFELWILLLQLPCSGIISLCLVGAVPGHVIQDLLHARRAFYQLNHIPDLPHAFSAVYKCLSLFYFIYSLVCVFVFVCAFVASQRAEEHITYPGAGVIDSCDPPDMDAHNQIQILWNSSMFSYPLQYGFNFICVYAE